MIQTTARKKSLSILLLGSLLVIGLSVSGCGKKDDDRTSSDPQQPFPQQPNQTVCDSIRGGYNRVLTPSYEDQVNYPNYWNGVRDRGIAKVLFPQYRAQDINGGGAYYSFNCRTNEYSANDSDLVFGLDQRTHSSTHYTFDVGFSGLDYGFYANLGAVHLDQVSLNYPSGVSFAANYRVPTVNRQSSAQVEADRFRNQGVQANGTYYVSNIPVQIGGTYLLRSIHFGRSDQLIAFQVIRQDPTDGSLVFIWKRLQTYNTMPGWVVTDFPHR